MTSILKPKRYEHTKWEDVPENIQGYIKDIRKSRKGLYIHGDVGTGKTHIAYSSYGFLAENGVKVKFVNTTELIFDIKKDFDRSPYDKKRHDEVLSEFKGVLILDDIGAERITDYVAEVFYFIINKRYNDMLPIIFTSNLTLGELADRIGDRTASRIIEMCDVVELKGEDRRILIAKRNKS